MSSFGSTYRVSTFGESHCPAVGCVVDGCPTGFPLSAEDIQPQLSRRRPGQSSITTPRNEKDKVKILSGVENGFTLGTPIALMVENEDHRPQDYSETDVYPRPSHADYTYLLKYGIKATSGGGRSSARETIGRVAAGAIAEKFLSLTYGIEIVAFTSSIGTVHLPWFENLEDGSLDFPVVEKLLRNVSREDVDRSVVRCPNETVALEMEKLILQLKVQKDSVGGTVTCVIRGCPGGLGEPCFDKLEAKLAHAMLSIPATKGFEVGSGFKGTEMLGSKHNDKWVKKGSALGTVTNFSGGIQGGISNGEHIYFKVGFKPAATIGKEQETASYSGDSGVLAAKGRHDPCVVPRAIPIVESMAALVVMDAILQQNSRQMSVAKLSEIAKTKGWSIDQRMKPEL